MQTFYRLTYEQTVATVDLHQAGDKHFDVTISQPPANAGWMRVTGSIAWPANIPTGRRSATDSTAPYDLPPAADDGTIARLSHRPD